MPDRRRAFVEELLVNGPVYPYTLPIARVAAQVDAETKSKGLPIPYADLLIGATALHHGFSPLTTNVRHVRLIPGLNVIPF